jgi:ribosomal-protein-alanine N-acetyltransferase
MPELELLPLPDVDLDDLVALMSAPRIGAHLPLLTEPFTAELARAFVAAKRRIWEAHGYGPWAFFVDGELAGWGGLQPEHGDADLALVLHPRFWGWGRRIFERVLAEAFEELGLASITALLPPNRPNARAVTRLGFVRDGQVVMGGAAFARFRLHRPTR